MKIVRTKNKILSQKDFQMIGRLLRNGGVVVYPTDTAYALGGIFSDKKVQERIKMIKGRRDEKFTLIASSQNQTEKFFPLTQEQKKLVKKYWPGALSLVVSDKYAVRVPKHELAKKLARTAQAPLVATSANLTGKQTPYSVFEALSQFFGRKSLPDVVIDAGVLPKKTPSTIVRVQKNGSLTVLRKGHVRVY